MVKFLHTADVHLGARFKYLGEKASIQREQLKKTFARVVSHAVEEKINIVLIAGDLFDSNTVSVSTIDFVKGQLGILNQNGIRVCILAGTHDLLDQGSLYLRERFEDELENVCVFTKDKEKCEYPDLDVTVWGKSNTQSKSEETPIISPKSSATKYNILMAHGSVQIEGKSAKDDYPITFEQIKNCGMDYVALGHWHSLGEYSQGGVKCYYSGSPEMLDIDQKGAGTILQVSIKDTRELEVKPVKVGSTDFVTLEIDLEQINNEEELKKIIGKDAHPNMIKTVELKGLVAAELAINTQRLEQELREDFFRLKIINNSHVKMDSIDEKNYPEELVTGQFVRLMKNKIGNSKDDSEKKLLERVLHLGLAELTGKNIL